MPKLRHSLGLDPKDIITRGHSATRTTGMRRPHDSRCSAMSRLIAIFFTSPAIFQHGTGVVCKMTAGALRCMQDDSKRAWVGCKADLEGEDDGGGIGGRAAPGLVRL